MKKHFQIGSGLAAIILLTLSACGQVDLSKLQARRHTGPAWTEEQWPKLLADLKSKMGDNPRLLRVQAERHFATFQFQDPKKPENVDAWQLRDGRLEGPAPVQLIGDGELEPSLFHWSEVALGKIPELCKTALEKLNLEAGEVVGVDVQRHFETGIEVRIAAAKSRERMERELAASGSGPANTWKDTALERDLRDHGQIRIKITIRGSRKMGGVTADASGEVIEVETY